MLRFLIRLLLLPLRIALAAVATGYRVGRTVGGVPVRITSRFSRLLGLRAVLALLVGLALGLLFAPGPGRELRERLRALSAARRATSDADLTERITFELEHAPRTWHLPQPEVTVVAGRVVLNGTVELASARDELGRVASAVPGVSAVENLVVVGTDDHDKAVG
jgi:hypothetical protein